MIHVLMYMGKPIAAAKRFERLNERMADYPSNQQMQMKIMAVEVLE